MVSAFMVANRLPKSSETSEVFPIVEPRFRSPAFWRTWLREQPLLIGFRAAAFGLGGGSSGLGFAVRDLLGIEGRRDIKRGGLDHPRSLARDDDLDPLVSLIEQRLAVRHQRDAPLELSQRLLQTDLASLQRADDLLQLAEGVFEREGSGHGLVEPKTRVAPRR